MAFEKIVVGTPRTEEQRQFKITELGELIEQQYAKRLRKPGFKQKTSFAPSKLGYGSGTCPRYWWYAFNGAWFEENVTPLGARGMDEGTARGTDLAEIFDEAGILIKAEDEARLDLPPVKGYIDLMVNWYGETVPGEIKTTKQEMFTIRETTMEATPYNLIQLLLYMKIKGLDKGFLLYENRNNKKLLPIPITMTPEREAFINRVLDWMMVVYVQTIEELPPERPFKKNSKECKECPVRRDCWNGPDGVTKILPLEVK